MDREATGARSSRGYLPLRFCGLRRHRAHAAEKYAHELVRKGGPVGKCAHGEARSQAAQKQLRQRANGQRAQEEKWRRQVAPNAPVPDPLGERGKHERKMPALKATKETIQSTRRHEDLARDESHSCKL